MREDHPIDRLSILAEGEAGEPVAASVRAAAQRMAGQRPWVLGPPRFVDEAAGDGIRVLGLMLSLYTALPPWDKEIDPETDRAHLEEVKALVSEIRQISAEFGVVFELDLAGVPVGRIEAGGMDDWLAVGLIGERERVLDSRSGTLSQPSSDDGGSSGRSGCRGAESPAGVRGLGPQWAQSRAERGATRVERAGGF